MTTPDELLAEMLTGDPDAARQAQLALAVRNDPALRQRFIGLMMIAGALRARHLPPSALAALRSRTLATLNDASVRTRSQQGALCRQRSTVQPRRFRGWLPLSMAAAVLLTLLILVERVPVAASVVSAGSDAVIDRQQTTIPAHAIGSLRSGDRLISGSHALTVVFRDGTLVAVTPQSRLVIERVATAKRLRLEYGGFTAQVAQQPPDQSLVVLTPRTSVTVSAANFLLSTGTDSDFISVQDGTVEVVRCAGDAHATLVSGRAAVAKDTQPFSLFTTTPHAGDGWSGSGSGLRGDYYADAAFIRLAATRIDANIRFDWAGSPLDPVPEDHFSVRWSGQLQPRVTGQHLFTLRAADGVRLWVDGQALIDTWNRPDIADQRGTILLEAGRRYDVRIDYLDLDRAGEITWWWEALGQVKEVVPASQLYPP